MGGKEEERDEKRERKSTEKIPQTAPAINSPLPVDTNVT